MKTFEFVLARNHKQLITLIPILFISFGLLFSAFSTAEARSNKGDIQREVEDGWTVAWGDEIDHWEYAELLTTITAAYLTSNPWLIYDYFKDLLLDMIQALGTETVLKALANRDTIWRQAEFEVQGGLATYDHWHDENPCSIWGGKCWTKVNEPNTHQPYVRWRRVAEVPDPDDGPTPIPLEPTSPDPSVPGEPTNPSEETVTRRKVVLMIFNQYLLKGF